MAVFVILITIKTTKIMKEKEIERKRDVLIATLGRWRYEMEMLKNSNTLIKKCHEKYKSVTPEYIGLTIIEEIETSGKSGDEIIENDKRELSESIKRLYEQHIKK